jgi:hypothetical protein
LFRVFFDHALKGLPALHGHISKLHSREGSDAAMGWLW